MAGHRDSNGDAEDGMGHGQRIKVAVTEKKQAGQRPPQDGEHDQHGVGQVGNRKQASRRKGGRTRSGQEPYQAGEKEALEQELLHSRPNSVGPIAGEEVPGAAQRAQSVQMGGDGNRNGREGERSAHDPK